MNYMMRKTLLRTVILVLTAFGLSFHGLFAPLLLGLVYLGSDFLEFELFPAFGSHRYQDFGSDFLADWRHHLTVLAPVAAGIVLQRWIF